MDKASAALAIAVGILLLLIWKKLVQAVQISPDVDVQAIVLIAVLVIGLTVYIRTQAQHRY